MGTSTDRARPEPGTAPAWLRGDAWIAGAAHDLKAPLAALEERAQDPAARNALEQIRLGIEELLDGFNASRARRLNDTTFDLDALIGTVRETCNGRAARAGIEIDVRASGLWLHASRGLCYRILVNLLMNAVVHSGASTVAVGARATPRGLRITVEDDGFGMPRDLLLAIEQRHQRGWDAGETLRPDPSGQGILTAMQLAGAMGGELLAVASKQGTAWHFDLPSARVGRPLAPPLVSDGLLRGRSIVILDDDPASGATTGRRFADLGATVRLFTDALPMFTAAAHGGGRIDLYVLDFLLADGDALRVIRMLSDFGAAAPIAVVTAHPGHPRLRSVEVPVFAKPLSDRDLGELCALIAATRSRTS